MMSSSDPHSTVAGLLLVPDGLIPTTAIIESALRAAISPCDVQVVLPDALERDDFYHWPVVFSRLCDPLHDWMPAWLHRHGARYAYYLDDNIWECRAASTVGAYYARPGVVKTLERYLARAACVLVSSEYLARIVAARIPGTPVVLVTAPFDFSRLPARHRHHRGPLRIGYAGTERGPAFEPVVEAIQGALKRFPGDFVFEFIGHAPKELVGLEGVTSFPPVADYGQFLQLKASRAWDAGLAPLANNAFARSKTNNKYREYGALGIAGIYSNVSPYRECVTTGYDGLLVENATSAWLEAFIHLANDRQLCASIGESAHRNVWDRHRVEVASVSWRSALASSDLRPARASRQARIERWALSLFAALSARASAYWTIIHDQGIRALSKHLMLRLDDRLRLLRR